MTGLLLVLMFVLTIFMVMQFVLRETITGQESELNDLSLEVAALAEALGLERDRSADLEGDLGRLNATLDDANAQAQAQSALIASLQQQQANQEAALVQAQTQISRFEAQVAALISQRDDALGVISDLEGAQAELQAAQAELLSEKERLDLALVTARGEIDAQTEAARLAAAEREAMEALIASLRDDGAAQAAELTAREAQISELQAELSDEERARLLEAEAAAALRERLQNADAELTAMTLALEAQRKEAEDTLTLLAAARAAEETLDLELAAALSVRQDTELAKQAVDRELSEVLAQLALARSDLEATRAAQAETEASLTQAQSAQGETVAQLQAALAEKDRLLAQLQIALTQQEQTQGTLVAAQSELERLSAQVATAEQDLERLRGEAALASGAAEQSAEQTARLMAQVAAAEDELQRMRDEAGLAIGAAQQSAQENARLEDQVLAVRAELQALSEASEIAAADAARTIAALTEELARNRDELASLKADLDVAMDDSAIEQSLAAALAARRSVEIEREEVQRQLAAALAAKLAAEQDAALRLDEAAQQAELLAVARETLSEERNISAEAARKAEVLNQQVAALRQQLSGLQAILDEAKARDAEANVQLQNLGSELNAALAQVASEERRRRQLEEAERKRLEEAAKALEAKAQDLEQYRSEFFGRLRDVLGRQEGVTISGDRFVFSSEVLFDPGRADLSTDGEAEVAKVAAILRTVADDIPAGIDWVIRVDGHTDNVPLSGQGEFADNWELSQARALSVVRYMVNFLGIPPSRLAANGFGQYQPVNSEDTPEARAQNRRIELKFTEK